MDKEQIYKYVRGFVTTKGVANDLVNVVSAIIQIERENDAKMIMESINDSVMKDSQKLFLIKTYCNGVLPWLNDT